LNLGDSREEACKVALAALGLLGDNVMIECGILQYIRLIYRAVRLGLELYEQWKAAQSALLQAAGQVS
jgi:hypothetical protein